MVSGEYRIGDIASFICEADRYLLANYNEESLKFVADGQPVEVALNLFPGQIFTARVAAIPSPCSESDTWLPSRPVHRSYPQPVARACPLVRCSPGGQRLFCRPAR